MRFMSIVFFVLWLILGWWMHSTTMDCCKDKSGTTQTEETSSVDSKVTDAVVTKASGPILFDYKSNKAQLGDNWDSFKSDWMSRMKDDDKMEIIGYYTADETTPSGFNNMGEARANAARIAMGLEDEQAILKGVLSDSKVNKTDRFKGVDFKVVSGKPASIEETVDDKTIIRFPYNSTNKLSDSAVEDYLDKVADRVKKSGERVRLTGHTDSDGRSEYNLSLGKQRADIIKQYLVRKGVSSSKIITSSKGETKPIASNSTNSGKAENRRTELEIIK